MGGAAVREYLGVDSRKHETVNSSRDGNEEDFS